MLFDARPIRVVDGFEFRARSVVIKGRPTFERLKEALTLAVNWQESSPYWVSDLIAYAETRHEWSDLLDDLMSSTGLARQTLINRASVGRHVDADTRELAPSPAHAEEVASLTPAEQRVWLDKARSEGMSRNEMRREIRAAKRRRTIEGQATLEGQFRVIYADPPWKYGSGTKGGSRVEDHYPPMEIADICKLPVEAHSMPDAVLFMWVTAPLLYQNPGPRDVIEAWGFTAKSNLVWNKVHGIGGNYLYVQHEHLIIATRGSCLPDVASPMIHSVYTEQLRDRNHSSKPPTIRKAIERVYTKGPYLELFGREPVDGWTVFGNDARLWHEQV